MMTMLRSININYIYALHIIFMVFWIAGLFFTGRLFIYDRQAQDKKELEKKVIQDLCRGAIKKTYYIIIWPSLIITITCGLKLMEFISAHKQNWFHSKMLFVILLVVYTLNSQRYLNKINKDKHSKTNLYLRIYNEIPGILLIIIVFTVYAKNLFAGLTATFIFLFLIMLTVLIVKTNNSRKTNKINAKE